MTEFNQVGDSNNASAPFADCAPVTGGREAKPNRRLCLRVTMPLLGLLIVAGLRFSMQETVANWYTCCSSGYYCWLCPYTGDDWPCEGGDGGDGSGDNGFWSGRIGGGGFGGRRIGGGGTGIGQTSGRGIDGGIGVYCDGSSCGMPVWSVSEPSLNLWLDDTPLFYKPSRGSAISFRLLYKNEMDIS